MKFLEHLAIDAIALTMLAIVITLSLIYFLAKLLSGLVKPNDNDTPKD